MIPTDRQIIREALETTNDTKRTLLAFLNAGVDHHRILVAYLESGTECEALERLLEEQFQAAGYRDRWDALRKMQERGIAAIPNEIFDQLGRLHCQWVEEFANSETVIEDEGYRIASRVSDSFMHAPLESIMRTLEPREPRNA